MIVGNVLKVTLSTPILTFVLYGLLPGFCFKLNQVVRFPPFFPTEKCHFFLGGMPSKSALGTYAPPTFVVVCVGGGV